MLYSQQLQTKKKNQKDRKTETDGEKEREINVTHSNHQQEIKSYKKDTSSKHRRSKVTVNWRSKRTACSQWIVVITVLKVDKVVPNDSVSATRICKNFSWMKLTLCFLNKSSAFFYCITCTFATNVIIEVFSHLTWFIHGILWYFILIRTYIRTVYKLLLTQACTLTWC